MTTASTALGSSLAPTAGLKIDLGGGFSIRGSIATTNRYATANLSRLQAASNSNGGGGPVGPQQTFQILDPLRGGEAESVLASDEANPNIQLEGDVTRDVGFIFQRGKIHRLRVSTEFSDTIKSNEEIYLGPQDIVDLEGLYPGRVMRAAPSPGDPYSVGVK